MNYDEAKEKQIEKMQEELSDCEQKIRSSVWKLKQRCIAIRNSLDILNNLDVWIEKQLHSEERILEDSSLHYEIMPTNNGWMVLNGCNDKKEVTSLEEAIAFAKADVTNLNFKDHQELIEHELKEHGIDDFILLNEIMGRIRMLHQNHAIAKIKRAWKANLRHHRK